MPSMDLIKKLRENTGCGISDCNKALKESNDDYEKAVEWLRKKGLSSAAKKSARVTSEGLIGIKNNTNIASIIEVNSETDFVARNAQFQDFVLDLLDASLDLNENDSYKFVEILKNQKSKKSEELISQELTNNIATIGENIQIRRGKTISVDKGAIVSYTHSAIAPNLGKIGVLVAFKSDADKSKIDEFGKGIAMHIAAMKPEFLKETDIPTDRINKEKEIAREQLKKQNKPDDIIEKIVMGKLNSFYKEVVLLDQESVVDPDKRQIKDLLKSFEKETGKSIEIADFVLFVLGEGIEKKSQDFASEVASMIK